MPKNRNKKNNIKENRWQNIRIAIAAIAMILFGVLMLVFNHIHDYRLNTHRYIAVSKANGEPVNIEYMDRYDQLWKPIVNNVGITLIVLGIGSLFLELYGYASYFQKKVSEVFTEQKMLDFLNEDYKKQLKSNVIKSIYSPNTIDSQAIVSLFDDNIADLLNSVYYSRFDFTTEISLYQNKYIKKQFVRVMKINEINTDRTNNYKDIIDIYCQKIDDEKITTFTFDSLEIDDIELKKEEDYFVKSEEVKRGADCDNYTVHHCCRLKEPLEINGSVKVKICYSTIVPINDMFLSFKTDTLCKNFYCSFVFNENEFDVDVIGFNFTTSKRPFEILSSNNWKSIRSQGWLLPGEGILCTTVKKTENENAKNEKIEIEKVDIKKVDIDDEV